MSSFRGGDETKSRLVHIISMPSPLAPHIAVYSRGELMRLIDVVNDEVLPPNNGTHLFPIRPVKIRHICCCH